MRAAEKAIDGETACYVAENPKRFRLYEVTSHRDREQFRFPAEFAYLTPPPELLSEPIPKFTGKCTLGFLLNTAGYEPLDISLGDLSLAVGVGSSLIRDVLKSMKHRHWIEVIKVDTMPDSGAEMFSEWPRSGGCRKKLTHIRRGDESLLRIKVIRRPGEFWFGMPHSEYVRTVREWVDGGQTGTAIVKPARAATFKVVNYRDYLQSPEWQARRRQAIYRAGRRCQLCNASNVVLDTHHRTYERIGREYDTDLIVLCRNCHTIFHENGKVAKPPMT
jgi:hypothetical protein